jgi:hypothetical protein
MHLEMVAGCHGTKIHLVLFLTGQPLGNDGPTIKTRIVSAAGSIEEDDSIAPSQIFGRAHLALNRLAPMLALPDFHSITLRLPPLLVNLV